MFKPVEKHSEQQLLRLEKQGYFICHLELVERCCEIISHLRILNINVIESVLKWRDGFLKDFQITDERVLAIPFIYEK